MKQLFALNPPAITWVFTSLYEVFVFLGHSILKGVGFDEVNYHCRDNAPDSTSLDGQHIVRIEFESAWLCPPILFQLWIPISHH
jgi:hypothetical protein